MASTVSAPSVTVTERAAAKAQSLLAAKGHPDGMLRVFVVGGGCSGYQYGMALAAEAEADDTVVAVEGLRILIDPDSAGLIGGAEVDYVESFEGSGFKFNNPNVKSTCGCGSSFSA